MAISGHDQALMFALSGVMRSGASRSNYLGTGVFISIGGIEYGDNRPNKAHRVLRESLSIVDALNDEPNTCSMRTKGFVPPLGAEIIIRLGSTQNGRREFAGRITQTTQSYWDNPQQDEYAVSAIDYTWGLNQRKVTARYTGTATTIAQLLIAQWAPGYSSAQVAPNLPTVDGGITFTHQDLTDCLTQLAKRIGASWFVDYHKTLHLFTTDTSATDPLPLTLTHPTGRDLAIQRDASQWVTRAVVEAGGVTAMTDVAIGETLLPIETIVWYPPSGGLVTAGPQHVRYTGVLVGGAGALVGTGAQPSAPVTAVPATSNGSVDPGRRGYAYTYVTQAGESLPGPTTFTDGLLGGPTTAPTIGTPGVGAGPNAGTHDYAVAFRTATGESLVGPRATGTTGYSAPPATPTTPTATSGAGLPPATFDYAVTFVTPAGETTIGPVSSTVTTSGQVANAPVPGISGTGPNDTQGDLIPGNYYGYAVAWSTAPGQTTHSEQTALVNFRQVKAEVSLANAAKSSHILLDVPFGPAGVTWCHLYRVNQTQVPNSNPQNYRLLASFGNGVAPGTVRFTDTIADSAIAGASAGTATNTTPAFGRVSLTSLPKGGSSSGVTGRRVYRRQAGGAFGLVYNFANDNVTTSFIDALATPGVAPPTLNTATALQLPVTNIPIGGPLVTMRAIYRTAANSPTLQLLTWIGDNTTTSFVDVNPDSVLGGPPAGTGSASATAIQVGSIAVGPSASGGMVIQRNLYRTTAGGSQLRLLAYLADNVTTTFLDPYADAQLLTTPPPTFDLSGLKQPEGSVNAGATAIPVSGAGWAPATGGWVIIGNGAQVVRYQSVSGNTLVGIPSSGPGSITATITFNSSITVAPLLTGIPASGPESIRVRIVKGDDVNLIVIVDDVASQNALAALIGGDGVQEEFLQDRRLSYDEAVARAEALLALRGRLLVSVSYTARDLNSHAGRLLHVDLGPPFNLLTDLRIQRSTATFAIAGQLPLYSVEASTARFSFEDLLRMARLTRGT